MSWCKLEKDIQIGHQFIVKEELFLKKVELKKIMYNGLMDNIFWNEKEELDPGELYSHVLYNLKTRIEANNMNYLNGHITLNSKKVKSLKCKEKEDRINSLKFNFTNAYLNRALKILEENQCN